MSARTIVLPNLLNGVSTQAASLRLLTQGSAQVNGYSTLTGGLVKRPPTVFIKNMGTLLSTNEGYVHLINRDESERYYVIITDGNLRVYDLEGNQKTVNFPKGKDYLSHWNPRGGFSTVTVADYTFVVNKRFVAKMGTAKTFKRLPEALVNVIAGNYAKRHKIFINGDVVANYRTGDGVADAKTPDDRDREIARLEQRAIATDLIASALCWGLNPPGTVVRGHTVSDGEPTVSGAGEGSVVTYLATNLMSSKWDLLKIGNAIHIQDNNGQDFNIRVEDGFNGNAMKAIKGKCQRFSDLPIKAPNGFHCEITGESSNSFDNYYVKFKTTNGEMDGVWEEAIAQDIPYQIDETTMPHVLIRESDGSFTFKPAPWNNRKVGDEESNPDPSFIGQRINDVFYHRGRLGIIAGENVCLSRSNDVFDFWRKTVTTILDTDPIDVGPSFPKVSTFKHAQSFNGDLLLFSEGLQARMTGGDVLTPKTAAIKLLGEYQVDTSVRPVSSGSFMYWAARDNDRTLIRELWLDETGVIQPPLEANSHCPDFVPKGVFKLAVSSDLNMLVATTNFYKSRLYVYKYYWAGKEKPQSSWSYWSFDDEIISADFVDTDLYLLLRSDTSTRLVKMPCQVGYKDPDMDFMVMLDKRVELVGGSYNEATDRTSYTLPYAVPQNIEAWTGFSASSTLFPGLKLEIDSLVNTTLRLKGDTRSEKVYAGVPYTFRYEFSPLYIRVDNGGGSALVATEGRTQVLRMRITYAKTAYFKVVIDHETKPAMSYPINDHLLDDGMFKTTKIVLEDGDVSIPVKAENDKITITVVNDQALPSSLISAEWVGLWYPKTRRM